jgi:hypothetical protein
MPNTIGSSAVVTAMENAELPQSTKIHDRSSLVNFMPEPSYSHGQGSLFPEYSRQISQSLTSLQNDNIIMHSPIQAGDCVKFCLLYRYSLYLNAKCQEKMGRRSMKNAGPKKHDLRPEPFIYFSLRRY